MQPNFKAHRDRLLSHLGDDEAVLVFGGPHHIRNGDAEYRYRPDSDVYWLTGWEQPDVAVFLRPGDAPLTLFCQARDPEREVWEGYRPGPEGARDDFGADAAFVFGELEAELPRLLQGVRTLHYGFARHADHDALLMSSIAKAARAARKNGLDVPETFVSPSKLLHELRLAKQDDEVPILREAARITAEAHLAAMQVTAPDVYEFEVEAALQRAFTVNGSTGAGYTPIVAGGANACVLHYITNREKLKDGDLLLIDAGGEYCYYTADVTRTFPVNGRFTEPQRRVYQWVLDAQLASIDAARAGRRYGDVHDASVRVLTEGMVALGLLEGDVDTLIETEAFKKYYMHGTSHWLGLDVHDVGVYGRDGATRELGAGMLLTVEPGLYIAADDESAPEDLRGIGIRIEDDVLVTEGEPEVMTAAIPKTIDDIEAVMAAGA